MAENKIVKVTYTAEADKQSFNRVNQQLKQQSQEQIKTAKNAENITKKQVSALDERVKLEKKLATEQKKAEKQELDRLKILEKQNSELRNQVGSVGDVDTALSAIRGGIGGITGVDVGGLEQVAGVFELTEAVAQLKGAAPAAKEAIVQFAGSLGAGGIGLVAVAGIATAGMIALGNAISKADQDAAELAESAIKGFGELKQAQKEGTLTGDEVLKQLQDLELTYQAQNETLDATQATYDNYINSFGAIRGAVDAVSQQSATYREEIEKQKDEIRDTELAMQGLRSAFASGGTTANDQAQAIVNSANVLREQFQIEQQVRQFSKTATEEQKQERLDAIESEKLALQEIQNTLKPLVGTATEQGKEATKQFQDLANQINKLNTESGLLNGVIGQEITLRSEQIAQDERAEKAKEAINAKLKEQQEIDKERESALTRLVNLETQATDALQAFADKQAELTQDRQLRDLRELEDYQTEVERANSEHQRELLDIQNDGNSEIAKLEQSIRDTTIDFFTENIDAQEQYQKDLKRIDSDYYRETKQAHLDHLQSLRDAEQNNDVLAFLQAQRDYEQQETERKQARKQETKDLTEEYQQQTRERQRAFRERQADIQREIQASRQATEQRISDTKAEYELEQRLADEDRQRKLQRQAQDDAIADARSQEALQQTLNGINIKAQAEISAIRQVTSAVGELQAVANRIGGMASGGSMSSSSSGVMFGSSALGTKSYERNGGILQRGNTISVATSSALSSSKQFGRAVRVAFANGGIVDSPTVALLGENLKRGEGEAVIPFRLSEGLASAVNRVGGGGSSSPVINFAPNVTVGDIASSREVTSALQEFANDLSRQLYGAFNGAVNNAG